MQIKTSELTDVRLDWAVLKCEVSTRGVHADYLMPSVFMYRIGEHDFNYSTDWAQGGPIIEREEICLKKDQPPRIAAYEWNAWTMLKSNAASGRGPTPLIAAMRAYVASQLGDEVDVPEELL
jgi:hypothetical protein